MDSDGEEEVKRGAKAKAVKCRQYCIARGCTNSNRSDPDLSFFSLPKDEHRRRQWLKSVERADLLRRPGLKHKSHVVCLAHFWPDQLRWVQHLRPDAVPSAAGPAGGEADAAGGGVEQGSDSRDRDGSSMLQKILLRVKPASRSAKTQTDSTLESHAAEELAALRAARRALLAEYAACTRRKLARLHTTDVLVVSGGGGGTGPPAPPTPPAPQLHSLESTRTEYNDYDADTDGAGCNVKVEPDLCE